MGPEVAIGILAVFISGGALGVGTTLFCQWAHRKLTWNPYRPGALEDPERSMLRSDLADLSRTVGDLQDRMEFQERLLSGGSPPGLSRTNASAKVDGGATPPGPIQDAPARSGEVSSPPPGEDIG